MSDRKHLPKHKLAQRITHVTNIRQDVVEEVLEGLVSVAIEEICSNDGHFRLSEFFTIEPESVKGYTTKLSVVPPHKRLRVRLSEIPKIMYKIQQDQFPNDPDIITAANWREVFDHYRQESSSGGHRYSFQNLQPTTPPQQPARGAQHRPETPEPQKRNKPSPPNETAVREPVNPFLEDDTFED